MARVATAVKDFGMDFSASVQPPFYGILPSGFRSDPPAGVPHMAPSLAALAAPLTPNRQP